MKVEGNATKNLTQIPSWHHFRVFGYYDYFTVHSPTESETTPQYNMFTWCNIGTTLNITSCELRILGYEFTFGFTLDTGGLLCHPNPDFLALYTTSPDFLLCSRHNAAYPHPFT